MKRKGRNGRLEDAREAVRGDDRQEGSAEKQAWWWMLVMAVVVGLVVSILVQIEVGPVAYMDEIFHLRQTYQYCYHGNWSSWDDKITTLPGLYGLSTGFSLFFFSFLFPVFHLFLPLYHTLWPWISSILPSSEAISSPILIDRVAKEGLESEADSLLHFLCSSSFLRPFINPALSIISIYIVHKLLLSGNRSSETKFRHFLKLAIIFAFPLSFFFNYLFYTDTGSLVFVLLTKLAITKERLWLSVIPAICAILFRQTNVVWVALIICTHLVEKAAEYTIKSLGSQEGEEEHEFKNLLLYVFNNLPSLIKSYFGQAIIMLAFLVFMKWNGGITVGDRNAHKPILHFPQILYFLAFYGIFSLPSLLLSLDHEEESTRPKDEKVTNDQFLGSNRSIQKEQSQVEENSKENMMTQKEGSSESKKGKKSHPKETFIPSPSSPFFSILSAKIRSIILIIASLFTISWQSVTSVAFLAFLTYSVHFHSYAHPYLLSDNRHYTFYIWQRLFQRFWWFKYLLVPVAYLLLRLTANLISSSLAYDFDHPTIHEKRIPRHRGVLRGFARLWTGFFFGFTFLTLIPSPLLEFRYFIVPFVLLSIQSFRHGQVATMGLVLQLGSFLLLNAVTFYLFLYKPFHWDHPTEPIARFLW